jgi:PPOX class probable F420-dependent enzyme
MDNDELIAFLTGEPSRTATLATVRADGRPHVAPVWYVLDPSTADADAPIGDVIINTGTDSLKGRNLRRQPLVSLCVDDDRPPFSFVTIDGLATVSEEPDELLHWATVIGGRYMGQDRAEEFGRRNGVPGELLVRIRPTHIVALADLAE